MEPNDLHHEPDESGSNAPTLINIIFPSASMSSEWSLPFKFPCHNTLCISLLPLMCHMHRPSQTPWSISWNNILCSKCK